MSNTDSFIDEVSEEVRRDRLFVLLRRYGWIAILAVLVLVGGAAWNEWQKAQARAQAEALGDAILAALEVPDRAERATALQDVTPAGPGSAAVLRMMAAAEAMESDPAEAAQLLLQIADSGEAAPIYAQIATLKAVMIENSGLDADQRRGRLDGLALGQGVIRLLAEEQLAYLDIEVGDTDAAIDRLQQVAANAETTPGLRRRATQVIVALGGDVTLPETLTSQGEAQGND
ncbi:tetratricopeptide repeat protein [Rhodobacteraceae bacterium KMM 6894]|nr:tetratricopeptide repeat protein [Rhodobacteraceae bacterium KMM 6894]